MDKILYKKIEKQLALLFAFGLFGGCIYFNVLWRMKDGLFRNEWGMVFDYILDISALDMYRWALEYVWWAVGFCLLLGIIGFFGMGRILLQGIVLAVGFFVGAVETLLLLSFSLEKGALFLGKVIVVLGPYIFFLAAALMTACAFSELRVIWLKKTEKWKQIQLKRYMIIISCNILLQMVYILVCSYVNFGKLS